ncbi:MAG: glycosyltransferase family 39 protein [Lentisphaeria bacterium]|nr:glycosyltransferase family 39 protein [Lentisphaeria bacterium]
MKRHVKKADAPPEKNTFTFTRRRFLLFAAAAVLVGVLLRLWAAFDFAAMNGGANNMMSPAQVTDMATYIDLADKIASGSNEGPFNYQPFYYAVFLPLIRIWGGGVWAVVAVQILLGGATIWLTALIGERLVGKVGGLLAAWLTSLSPALILYAPFHLNETLQAFNLTLLFCLLLIAFEKRKWHWWALCGFAAGVAALTRGNALLLVLPVAALGVRHFICDRTRRWVVILHAAVFAAALLLVELPFIWHNTRATGRLCGPSTAAGEVLALGNTPEAPPGGREPGLPAGPMEYPESWHRMMKLQAEGVSVPRQMWEWFRREPGAFLELQFRKALLFWDGREIPNNVSLYGEGRANPVLCHLEWGGFNPLVVLALAGMLLGMERLKRGEGGIFLLYGFVIVYWLSIAMFYDLSRFRAPILPLAAVFAGVVADFLSRRKSTPLRRMTAFAAVLAGVFVSAFAYESYRSCCEAAVMRLVRPDGTKIIDRGGETWIFDHGPQTFGSWEGIAAAPGMKLEKRFVGGNAGKARLKVFSAGSGVFLTDRGGTTLKPGENELLLGVLPADGRLVFTVLESPPGAMLVIDRQRNYGRTRINGETVPGELVARFSPVL